MRATGALYPGRGFDPHQLQFFFFQQTTNLHDAWRKYNNALATTTPETPILTCARFAVRGIERVQTHRKSGSPGFL